MTITNEQPPPPSCVMLVSFPFPALPCLSPLGAICVGISWPSQAITWSLRSSACQPEAADVHGLGYHDNSSISRTQTRMRSESSIIAAAAANFISNCQCVWPVVLWAGQGCWEIKRSVARRSIVVAHCNYLLVQEVWTVACQCQWHALFFFAGMYYYSSSYGIPESLAYLRELLWKPQQPSSSVP